MSREAVHRHREIVAKRRRGVGAPLSAPRKRRGDSDGDKGSRFKFVFFCAQNITVSQSENQNQKRFCTDRESNPGLYRGRVLFYH